jgi:glycosyltransferase involved in cell wall biosynthesis
VSRQGRGPLTGVDRVEFAYLSELLSRADPVFGLVRTRFGFVLLDRPGMRRLRGRLLGGPSGKADLIGRLSWRRDPKRAAAEADARRGALARGAVPLLGRVLRQVPEGIHYLNVGHANLTDRVMRAVKARGGRIAVLVHDTIPLDHPEFTRPGIPQVFARKLAVVARNADLVIHSTEDARQKTEAHLARMGRVPPALVVPLGVDVPQPDPATRLPARPYAVAIGTIEPRKNIGLLLDAWDLGGAAMPELMLLGGRGWEKDALFDRIATSPKVTHLPGQTDGQVAALLAGSLALLFPSRAEGFGLPPVEAAALGVPVIASELSVLHALLGDYPVYLDPSDIYAWKETIRALAERAETADHRNRPITPPDWKNHFNSVLRSV